jgi:Flp pilus assembly protein TadD
MRQLTAALAFAAMVVCAAGCSTAKAPAPTTTSAPTSAPPVAVTALDDLDDAIRAINWSRNVRFQQEISEAATNLRECAALSASTIAEDC